MAIWLIHGFNTWDNGRGTVDRLAPLLKYEGYEVQQFDYGWTFLLGARFGNAGRARKLAKQVKPGDVAIGHSNGCAIIHRASHLGAPFKQVIYISPALDRQLVPDWWTVRDMTVYYSPSDTYVQAASWIPGVIWGDMGAVGCTARHDAIHNYNKDKLAGTELEHSKVFEQLYIRRFYNHLGRRLRIMDRDSPDFNNTPLTPTDRL